MTKGETKRALYIYIPIEIVLGYIPKCKRNIHDHSMLM